MASSVESEATNGNMKPTHRVHIADISNSLASDTYLEAYIVLVWPYSSVTKQFSLLIAEKDVSLSKAKGQVKVTFHDEVAREVAKLRPGIGDDLKLALVGTNIIHEEEELSTPGKKAGFSIHLSHDVQLEINNHAQDKKTFSYTVPETTSKSVLSPDSSVHLNQTPRRASRTDIPASGSGKIASRLKTTWLSSPLNGDDLSDRPRKRTKFARSSGAWRLIEDTELELQEPTPVAEDLTPIELTSNVQPTTDDQSEHITLLKDNSSDNDAKYLPDTRSVSSELAENDSKVTAVTSDQTIPDVDILLESREAIEALQSSVQAIPQTSNTDNSNENTSMRDELNTAPIQPNSASSVANADILQHFLDAATSGAVDTVDNPTYPSIPLDETEVRDLINTELFPVAPASFTPATTSSIVDLDALHQHLEDQTPSLFDDSDIQHPRIHEAEASGRVSIEQDESEGVDYGISRQSDHPDNVEVTQSLSVQTVESHPTFDASTQNLPLAFDTEPTAPSAQIDLDTDDVDSIESSEIEVEQLPVHGDETDPYSSESDSGGGPEDSHIEFTRQHTTIVDKAALLENTSAASEVEMNLEAESGSSLEQDDDRTDLNSVSSNEKVTVSNLDGYDSEDDEESKGTEESVVEQVELHSRHIESEVDIESGEENEIRGPETDDSELEQVNLRGRFVDSKQEGESGDDDEIEGDEEIEQTYESDLEQVELRGRGVGFESEGESEGEGDNESVVSGSIIRADEIEQRQTADVFEADSVKDPHAQNRPEQLADDQTDSSQDSIPEEAPETVVDIGQAHPSLQRNETDGEAQADAWLDFSRSLFTPTETIESLQTTAAISQAEVVATLNTDTTMHEADPETPMIRKTYDLDQVDGPNTEFFSRRKLLSRLPSARGRHSEYFTPRKSIIKQQETQDLHPPDQLMEFSPGSGKISKSTAPIDKEQLPRAAEPESINQHDLEDLAQQTAISTSGDLQMVDDVEPMLLTEAEAHPMENTQQNYCISLSRAIDYFDQNIDIVCIVTTDNQSPDRAKSGPRDFFVTLHLADSTGSLTAQAFRPYREALPSVKRGDVLLLRSFTVKSRQRKAFLISNDESAWAVLHLKDKANSKDSVVMTGPPIEYGAADFRRASGLLTWWHDVGQNNHDPQQDTSKPSETTQFSTLPPRRSPRQSRKSDMSLHDNHSAIPSSPTFVPESPFSQPVLSGSTAVASQYVAEKEIDDTTLMSGALLNKIHHEALQTPLRNVDHGNSAVFRGRDVTDSASVITSSTSSRQHRNERKDTSVVHELRDGTQWIDVPDAEIVSVSTEGDQDHIQDELNQPDGDEEGRLHDETRQSHDDPAGVDESNILPESRPSIRRHTRSQSRLEPPQFNEPVPEPEQSFSSSPPRRTRSREEPTPSRMTRSRAARGDSTNIHELRDGSKYQN